MRSMSFFVLCLTPTLALAVPPPPPGAAAATTPAPVAAVTAPPVSGPPTVVPPAPSIPEVVPGNRAWSACAPHRKVQVAGKETKDDKSDDKFALVVKKLGTWTEAETTTALACRIEIGGVETSFGSHTKIEWDGTHASCPTGLVLGPESGLCTSSYQQGIERAELASRGFAKFETGLAAVQKDVGVLQTDVHALQESDVEQNVRLDDNETRLKALEAEKVAAEKVAAEKVAAEKVAAEKVAAEKVAAEKRLAAVEKDVSSLKSFGIEVEAAFKGMKAPTGRIALTYAGAKGVGGIGIAAGGGFDGQKVGWRGEAFGNLASQGSLILGLDGEVYLNAGKAFEVGIVGGVQDVAIGLRSEGADGVVDYEYSGLLLGLRGSVDLAPAKPAGPFASLTVADFVNVGYQGAEGSEPADYSQGLRHGFTAALAVGVRLGGYREAPTLNK